MRNCLAMFFADAHLSRLIWARRPEIHGDAFHAFRHLVGRACELQPKILVCAGDLLDSREPSSEVVSFLNRQLLRLREAGVDFGFVQGNHDSAVPPWSQALQLSHVKHLHLTRYELDDGAVCCGLDWQPAQKLPEMLSHLALQDSQVLVCHQAWEEFMGGLLSEGSLSSLPAADHVVTGDFHQYRKLLPLPDGAARYGTVFSPGATHLRSISEPLDHFYLTKHADGWKTRKIPGRPILRDNLGHDDHMDRFLVQWPQHLEKLMVKAGKLSGAVQKPLVIIDFSDEISQGASRLKKCLGDDAFLICRSYRKQAAETEQLVLDKQKRQDLLAHGLIAGLHHRLGEDHPHYGPLRRLLEARDPEEELLLMRRERGIDQERHT